MRLPSGTRIEETERVVARVESEIERELGHPDPDYPQIERHPQSDLRMLISNIGVLMDWPAAYTPNTGPMDAFVLVQLKEARRDVFELVQKLRAGLREKFPGVEFAFDTGGLLTAALNFGEPAPLHFQVLGSNLAILEELGRRVARRIGEVPGIEDVRLLERHDYPALEVRIDRTKAALLGLGVDEILRNLVTATNSSINFEPAFWIDERNGNHYFLGAQYPERDHVSVDTLFDIPLARREGGKPVPLRSVATITRGVGPALVSHRDITRAVNIYAGLAPGANLGRVLEQAETQLLSDPELGLEQIEDRRGRRLFQIGGNYAGRGYTLAATGEIQTMRSSFSEFVRGLFLAVVLVYLIMAAQLRSFLDPLVILLTVPLSLVGVAFTWAATGTTWNVQSLMGLILTVGTVVEYGILLLHFAREELARGVAIEEAAARAAEVRLRPILMTSLTTVLALLPMALGIGGGQASIPLARTMVGGVLAAAGLTLLVLPAVYVLLKSGAQSSAPEGTA